MMNLKNCWLWMVTLTGLLAWPPLNNGQECNAQESPSRNLLYVACPGVRNYLEYGGHGLLVFDIDQDHRWLRRIPLAGLDTNDRPMNVKGICGSAATGRIFVSTIKSLMCLDVRTEELLWEKSYDGGCDRMSISPDGKFIYLPSFEGPHWHVVDGLSGDVIARLDPDSGAHNTLIGLDGQWAYLAGLKSSLLSVADTSNHRLSRTIGPFSNSIRPFTINGRQTRCYVCLNDLLGFEVGNLENGKKLQRVEVAGFVQGKVKRHGCPSHGIGLTPDETEVWVADATNRQIHIFDNRSEPLQQLASIALADEPGWITFSLDGRWAYPSTGQVIETATRKVVCQLTDEHGTAVQSEKMLPVVVSADSSSGWVPIRMGDQFGIGRRL